MKIGRIQPDCTWSQMKQEGLGEVDYTPPSFLLDLSVLINSLFLPRDKTLFTQVQQKSSTWSSMAVSKGQKKSISDRKAPFSSMSSLKLGTRDRSVLCGTL